MYFFSEQHRDILPRYSRMPAPVFGTIGYYLIMFVAACLLISGIMALLGTISCKVSPINMFERFEDVVVSDVEKRTQTIAKGIQTLTEAMDRFSETRNDLCSVSDFVEEAYVGDKSAPTDESEYALSPDIQKERVAKRKQRATTAFQRMRSEQTGGKTIECFASSEEEEALKEKIKDFRELQKSEQYVSIFETDYKTIQLTLAFNAKYLKKGIDILAKEDKKNTERKQKSKEGFANQTMTLLEESDSVIKTIQTNLHDLTALEESIAQQKSALEAMTQKQKASQSGNEATKEFDEAQSEPKKLPENIYS